MPVTAGPPSGSCFCTIQGAALTVWPLLFACSTYKGRGGVLVKGSPKW